jgi:hypothetical protein
MTVAEATAVKRLDDGDSLAEYVVSIPGADILSIVYSRYGASSK